MSIQPRHINTTTPVIHGWVSSPDMRGTIDIINLCVATVVLSTYSALFLHIKKCPTRLDLILYKSKWVIFTIFFPEVTTAMAGEQWGSARDSVIEMRKMRQKYEEEARTNPHVSQTSSNTLAKMRRVPWTATHAFFADMGGMRLRCPDFPDFPVNTVHLLWLFKNGHIEYPEVEEETIKDKNKADTLARVITMLQVGWFTVQLIARGIQGLCITSLELSTLGFVCCALNIFWFWRKKPLDVVEPITIQCKGSLISIVRDAIATEKDGWQYTQTPLDCLDRESGTSYVRSFFYSMSYAVNVERKAHTFPATSIPNSAVSHTGCKRLDVVYGYFFGMLYFGIHFAGWNFHFPSTIESWLWRSSAITLACIAAMFEFVCSPGNRLGRYLPGKPTTGIGILKLLPKTLALLCLWPLIVTYFLARSYIIVEGFAGLRALPESAFQTINWWNFVPHI